MMDDRSPGVATPSSRDPPATVYEPRTDSHRTGVRWNCNPDISTAHDSAAFTRRRMSIRVRARIEPIFRSYLWDRPSSLSV